MKTEQEDVHGPVARHLCEGSGMFVSFIVLVSLAVSVFLTLLVIASARSVWGGGEMWVFSTTWLNLAFPVGLICVLIHHLSPGAKLRRLWFPRFVEVLFWVNVLGWLCAGPWLVDGVRMFCKGIWWLAWLCA